MSPSLLRAAVVVVAVVDVFVVVVVVVVVVGGVGVVAAALPVIAVASVAVGVRVGVRVCVHICVPWRQCCCCCCCCDVMWRVSLQSWFWLAIVATHPYSLPVPCLCNGSCPAAFRYSIAAAEYCTATSRARRGHRCRCWSHDSDCNSSVPHCLPPISAPLTPHPA